MKKKRKYCYNEFYGLQGDMGAEQIKLQRSENGHTH